VLKDKIGWRLAEQLITPYDDEDKDSFFAGDVNQALMEIGATYCAPSGTGVDSNDPLRDFYMSTRIGREVALEMKTRSFVHSKNLTQLMGQHRCKLCDADGMSVILNQIVDSIKAEEKGTASPVDRLSSLGHAAFPIAPPKKEKREEIIAIAAIALIDDSNSERWLMVKRPKDGLLAGQWEFPSACVWVSSNDEAASPDTKISLPFFDPRKRKDSIDSLLSDLLTGKMAKIALKDLILQCSRTSVGEEPIEHIFSHVRHTMWVEHGIIEYRSLAEAKVLDHLEWKSALGREVRWMTEEDLKSVGTTAGIKKVLAAVKKERSKSTTTKKRKSRAIQ